MTKAELVDSIASEDRSSQGTAERIVSDDLRRHRRGPQERRQSPHLWVRHVSGFGAQGAHRSQSEDRRSIQISASRSAKFKPGKTLKDSLN